MSAKPIYDLNRKIFDLIYDLTSSKFIKFVVKPIKAKKYLLNEIMILKSMFLVTFIYFKSNLIIFNYLFLKLIIIRLYSRKV